MYKARNCSKTKQKQKTKINNCNKKYRISIEGYKKGISRATD